VSEKRPETPFHQGSKRFWASRRALAGEAEVRRWLVGQAMIVFHGTTIDCLDSIRREGLRPGSFVSKTRAPAGDYSWQRAMTLGGDGCAVIELDVPPAAVIEVQSWWWAPGQLQLPVGCPATCILAVDDSDPPQFSTG
jgi:hypothetical protein